MSSIKEIAMLLGKLAEVLIRAAVLQVPVGGKLLSDAADVGCGELPCLHMEESGTGRLARLQSRIIQGWVVRSSTNFIEQFENFISGVRELYIQNWAGAPLLQPFLPQNSSLQLPSL